MPYIGKSPVGGGFHKLDALTASATATYALTLGSAAYYPETANQLLVSLNGIIQAPQDSFTVSGSNLVFDSALTASDSIDFVVALGDVLGVGSVTDGAVTTNKIANSAVTTAKINDGAVTAPKLAAGSVIGFANSTHNTQQNITSTSFVTTSLSVSYTNKKSDSLLLVEYHIPSEIFDSAANSEVLGETALYLDGTNVGATYQTLNSSENVKRVGCVVYSKYIQTTGDTSSHTWTVYAKVNADTFTIFRYGLTGHITVTEIAQ